MRMVDFQDEADKLEQEGKQKAKGAIDQRLDSNDQQTNQGQSNQ